MEVNPVRTYPVPSYPSLPEVRNHPELLERLPKRWRCNRAVMASLAVMTMAGASGCAGRSSVQISGPAPAMVAPVFNHGEGTGYFGGMPAVPPVYYLNEADALAIIKNEAAAAGILLDDKPEAYAVKAGTIRDPDGSTDTLGTGVSLELYDSEKNIAVSYISLGESEVKPAKTTITSYLMKQRAEQAAESWKEEGVPYAVGTFYDPGSQTKKQQLEKDLRAQVRDFIEWLKGQGVV